MKRRSELEKEIKEEISLPASMATFESQFLDNFHILDSKSGGHNYVLLFDLRKSFPGISRTEFDEGINRMRRKKIVSLDSADGRHVRLPPVVMDAAIREAGSILVYAALRR